MDLDLYQGAYEAKEEGKIVVFQGIDPTYEAKVIAVIMGYAWVKIDVSNEEKDKKKVIWNGVYRVPLASLFIKEK